MEWQCYVKTGLIAYPIVYHSLCAYSDNAHLYLAVVHIIHLFGHLLHLQQELAFHCLILVGFAFSCPSPSVELIDLYWLMDMYVTFAWICIGMLMNIVVKLIGETFNFDSRIPLASDSKSAYFFATICYIFNLPGFHKYAEYQIEHTTNHHSPAFVQSTDFGEIYDNISPEQHQQHQCTATFSKNGSNRKRISQKCVICHCPIKARQEVTLLSCFSTHRYHTRCIIEHWDTQLDDQNEFTCPLCNAHVQGLNVGVKIIY